MNRTGTAFWIGALLIGASLLGEGSPVGKEQRFRLKNGLKVILRHVQGTESAALIVLYSIGGDHDPEGRSGLAHLIEHIYVTAAAGESKARSSEEYMQAYPLGWNAQTGADYTVIATVFKGADLGRELKDAATRMRDLRVKEADLDREKPRLLREVASMFGGPPALAARNLAGEKVRRTPRRGRKGGVPDHVEAITLEEIRDRLRLYKPANATVILTGAFDPAAARRAIRKLFKVIPAGELAPDRAPVGEPSAEDLGDVVRVVSKTPLPGARPTACLAYRAPPPESDLYVPFLILVTRMIQGAALSGNQIQVAYPMMDEPEKVYLTRTIADEEGETEAIASLEKLVASAVSLDFHASEILRVKSFYSSYFWPDRTPDNLLALNLYGLGFGLGRRAQLGVDSGAIEASLSHLEPANIPKAGRQIFGPDRGGAVIVTTLP